ncbi:hypothetical protein C2G38_2043713 [Gigaspora rosea]|uniref:Uncharacterized protein n=1 Tax=Gigaspora rosea TaxID=44941 RepID=A0A397UIV5_9GLOM|nr:hypothetical protein C2G38_2043713 [Gigaspora rosea]
MPQVQDENKAKIKSLFLTHDLLPYQCKKYLEARRKIWVTDGTLYSPEIGVAICFSCNRLVYIGKRSRNIGNYNHIGVEKHWSTNCTGNKFCSLSYGKYLKIIQKPESAHNYEEIYVLHLYKLWMKNAIKKIQRAREVAKKIQAVKVIQQKWLEYFYRPDGLYASELAQHYKLLWAIREKMHQVSNA